MHNNVNYYNFKFQLKEIEWPVVVVVVALSTGSGRGSGSTTIQVQIFLLFLLLFTSVWDPAPIFCQVGSVADPDPDLWIRIFIIKAGSVWRDTNPDPDPGHIR